MIPTYSMGIFVLFPGPNQPELAADYSSVYNAEFNHEWNYTLTPPYAFMARTETAFTVTFM
jgi:hypothetical protein